MLDSTLPSIDPRSTQPSISAYVPFVLFGAFGIFWGAWGAALPTLQSRSGVSEGQLGTALLFVGLGALPAMLATGALLDRVGPRLAAPLLIALGGSGVVISTVATEYATLILAMLLVGLASGAADVAINTVSAQVEHESARPVLTRAHGSFSVAVVISSLIGGALLTGSGGRLWPLFTVTFTASVVAAVGVWIGTHGGRPQADTARGSERPAPKPVGTAGFSTLALIVVGLVGALAYATENAHQSWGAIFLTDTFSAASWTASLAPALFAAVAAATRLGLARWSFNHPMPALVGGGLLASIGSLVVATSGSIGVALLGLAIAAAGTAILFPTLLSTALRDVPTARRGRATSAISTTAYLGFILGPPYVGLIAGQWGLRAAIVAVALLAAVFVVTAAPLMRRLATR